MHFFLCPHVCALSFPSAASEVDQRAVVCASEVRALTDTAARISTHTREQCAPVPRKLTEDDQTLGARVLELMPTVPPAGRSSVRSFGGVVKSWDVVCKTFKYAVTELHD